MYSNKNLHQDYHNATQAWRRRRCCQIRQKYYSVNLTFLHHATLNLRHVKAMAREFSGLPPKSPQLWRDHDTTLSSTSSLLLTLSHLHETFTSHIWRKRSLLVSFQLLFDRDTVVDYWNVFSPPILMKCWPFILEIRILRIQLMSNH